MRINTNDLTLKRNYLNKYRFLISEYELVKAGIVCNDGLVKVLRPVSAVTLRLIPKTVTAGTIPLTP
jgi:hypothetical protein